MILPSNKKFGYFFTLVFFIISAYFFYSKTQIVMYFFGSLAILIFIITLVKADLLLPFNKLWMRFGALLGHIISPIVLGLIFFGLFTPYGIVMRAMKRDVLRLKQDKKESHWIPGSQDSTQTNFKQQF